MRTSSKIKVKAEKVWFAHDMLCVQLEDGREVRVPLNWFPRLRDASDTQRSHWRFIGDGVGIHWEGIDEDIAVEQLLA